MVKKFKTKIYEKDNDDHYVVVLNPWAKGVASRSQDQIDWIGAWLRIAFHNPKDRGIVKNIYTRNTAFVSAKLIWRKRSEVIARISSQVDVQIGLGIHRWGEFMEQKALRKVKEQTRVDLSENASHIFLYNWKFHGDPSERQWVEWYPLQEPIPRDVMIKWDYPEPEWSELPEVDGNLRSMLIPMRYTAEPSNVSWNDETINQFFSEVERNEIKHAVEEIAGQKRTDGDRQPRETVNGRPRASEQDEASSPEHPVNVQTGKIGKLDPYEAEDRALLNLKEPVTRHGTIDGIKVEVPDVRPKLEDPGYRPSSSLASAVDQLQNGVKVEESEEHKPFIKREDIKIEPDLEQSSYRPSSTLRSAISQLTGRVKPEPEDDKSMVKKEEYIPIGALRDAYSEYIAAAESASSKRTRGNSASKTGARAYLGSPDSRPVKRVKTEP